MVDDRYAVARAQQFVEVLLESAENPIANGRPNSLVVDENDEVQGTRSGGRRSGMRRSSSMISSAETRTIAWKRETA